MLKIPPDYPAVLAQIVLFLVLWLALKRLWFDPALRVLEAREKRSRGAVAEARALQDESERLRARHEAALAEARTEAQREVQEILRQAETEQRRLIGEATEEAARTVAEMRTRVAAEVATAREALRSDAHAIAREVATAVLGRTV